MTLIGLGEAYESWQYSTEELLRKIRCGEIENAELALITQCYKMAFECSPDPSTRNGCILVTPDYQLISLGWNAFPTGMRYCKSWLEDRVEKYPRIVHAEASTIFRAARGLHSTQGATLFGTWMTCTKCASAVAEAGVSRLVAHAPCHDRMIQDARNRAQTQGKAEWREDWVMDIERGIDLLYRCDIAFEELNTPIGGGVRALHGREVWYP